MCVCTQFFKTLILVPGLNKNKTKQKKEALKLSVPHTKKWNKYHCWEEWRSPHPFLQERTKQYFSTAFSSMRLSTPQSTELCILHWVKQYCLIQTPPSSCSNTQDASILSKANVKLKKKKKKHKWLHKDQQWKLLVELGWVFLLPYFFSMHVLTFTHSKWVLCKIT